MPEPPTIELSLTQKREALQQLLAGRTVDSIAAHHNVPSQPVQSLKDQLRNAFGPDLVPNPRTKNEEPPVEVGEILRDAHMMSEGAQGDGTTFKEGYTIIVPDTEKGDVVDIRIVNVNDTYAFAEPLDD